MNCATLANERSAIEPGTGLPGHARSKCRIVFPGAVLVSPGVELPGNRSKLAFGRGHKSRSKITRPGVVERDFKDFCLTRCREPSLGRIGGTDRHRHRLER